MPATRADEQSGMTYSSYSHTPLHRLLKCPNNLNLVQDFSESELRSKKTSQCQVLLVLRVKIFRYAAVYYSSLIFIMPFGLSFFSIKKILHLCETLRRKTETVHFGSVSETRVLSETRVFFSRKKSQSS